MKPNQLTECPHCHCKPQRSSRGFINHVRFCSAATTDDRDYYRQYRKWPGRIKRQRERERAHILAGLCRACDQPLKPGNNYYCVKHAEQAVKNITLRMNRLNAEGKCRTCQEPIPDGHSIYCEKHLLLDAIKSRRTRSRLLAEGKCSQCGKPLATVKGLYCRDCLIRINQYAAEKRGGKSGTLRCGVCREYGHNRCTCPQVYKEGEPRPLEQQPPHLTQVIANDKINEDDW